MADTKLTITVDTDEAKAKVAELTDMAATLSAALDAATEVRRLTLQPGDTIVLRVDAHLPNDAAAKLRDHVASSIGEGTKVLVLTKGMSIDVLAAAA
jgi:dUTPase